MNKQVVTLVFLTGAIIYIILKYNRLQVLLAERKRQSALDALRRYRQPERSPNVIRSINRKELDCIEIDLDLDL